MKKFITTILVSASLALGSTASHADEMGISNKDAYELVQAENQNVLFVDVRDPVEIMFIGFTDSVDLNIPYLMVDRNQWDSEKNRFRLYRNPDFIAQIEAALSARGMDKSATVITMCRSGSERGLPSAQFLQEHGFENARYVINGFQGSSVKQGEKKGLRIKNGWQNSGLPWQAKPNPEKIHRLDP